MSRKTRKSASGPENPIAASVHQDNNPLPRIIVALKRFFRRLLISVILITIFIGPPVLYYTDLVPPVKRELRKLVSDYSYYRKTEKELDEAKQKIESMEAILAKVPKSYLSKEPAIVTRSKSKEKVTSLRNGVNVRSYIDIRHGEIASSVREKRDAYELETRLKISLPAANKTIEELSTLNPELPKMLPGLGDLLEKAEVSPLFDKIYELKMDRVVDDLSSPSDMETRHNFYDCETVLELTHPKTKKKVILMQGEMDVVADGTDGDRWPYLNEEIASSRYFQHASSYRWKKKTDTPNPLLAKAEAELKKVVARYAVKGLSKTENDKLKSRRDELQRQIREMKSTSFLIAEVDPFIVLPLSFLKQSKLTHAPAIGDFAVVIYEDKLYPAICGDAGPSWKMGEGSLFMAKTLNPKSSPYYRPVSELKVTYLVFPETKPETNDAPDLIAWRNTCHGLLGEIGGLGEDYQLHNWRDLPAERKAIKSLNDLTKEFSTIIDDRNKTISETGKALTEAEKKAKELRAEVVKLTEQQRKRESEATSEEVKPEITEKEVQKVKEEWLAAEEIKIVLEKKLEQDEAAAKSAKKLSENVKVAIEKAKSIAELPESTPRELSTDIVLNALADNKAAVDMLKNE